MSKAENSKRWREANREKHKRQNAAWYLANKERHAELGKQWRKNNKDKLSVIRRRWRDLNPERQLLHNAKMRARRIGVPFSLVAEDIVIPTHCPVLGLKLVWTGTRGRTQPNTISLDRFDPRKGYVKGNICVISWRANSLKRDGTLEELEAIVNYLKNSFQSQTHDFGDLEVA